MLCCSIHCEKYNTCGNAAVNHPDTDENIEPFNCFGWGSYTYNAQTREVRVHHETMCNNFSLYTPLYHQITMDEILKES